MFNRSLSVFYSLSGEQKAGLLIGFLLVENNISMLPNVGSLYYGFMFVALLYILKMRQLSIGSLSMWGLYMTCLLSIGVNDVPTFFQPYQRFLSFFIITLLVSPAIYNDAFTRFRSMAFVTILKLLQYVIVISGIWGMMGGGYNRFFQGITNHSMMMAPFAGLCLLYSVYRLLANSCGNQDRKVSVLYGAILLLALFCLLQAASRAAFVGTLVSVTVFWVTYNRGRLGKSLKVIISVCVVLTLSFPMWNRYMDKLEEKNRGNTTELNMDSRERHWKQRLNEFQSSPFWGVGFASVSTNVNDGSNFSMNGKVETGNSWLSILSMIGLFGFVAFLSVFLIVLKRVWRMWYDIPLLSSFIISIMCFWALHMMAEGYILAGGNSLAFCVWLTLGVAYGVTNKKNLAYELQQKLAG